MFIKSVAAFVVVGVRLFLTDPAVRFNNLRLIKRMGAAGSCV